MDDKNRTEILKAYGSILEKKAPEIASVESELPVPKLLLRILILEELLYQNDPTQRNALELGFVALETFLPDDDYKRVKKACMLHEELIRKGHELKNLIPDPPSLSEYSMNKAQEFFEKNKAFFTDQESWNDYSQLLTKIQENMKRRQQQLEAFRELLGCVLK